MSVGGETQSGITGKKRMRDKSVAQVSTQQASRLTDKDMKTVINEIWKVRASFYNLGMNLDIDMGTLDVAKRKGDDGEALNLIIKKWLQKNKPKPTWKALIQALRKENIDAGALANEIAAKYCPDQITTESDSEEEPDDETDIGGYSPPKPKIPRRISLDDSSPTVEHEIAGDPRWCTAVTRLEPQPGVGPVRGTAAAVAVLGALWDKDKRKLGVKFIGDKSLLRNWTLENGNKMTTEKIIEWANTWWRKCDPSNVPRFVDVDSEPGLNDDIRVQFNDQGANWSWIGTQATQLPNKPTMHLSLKYALSDSWKRYYIIHEFGHALGLGHEHQRSKFWQFLHPYVNIEMMKKDPAVGGDEKFKNDWASKTDTYYSSDLGANSGKYDPKSIMHYGFKVEWLNRTPLGVGERDYSHLGNIETDHDDKILSDDAYAVLKGVHESGGLNTAKTPSDEDISFLKQCYDVGISNEEQGQLPSQNQALAQSGPSPALDSHQQEPEGFPEDVTTWSYQQVFEYFNSNPDCKEYAQFFLDEEVKGEDLLDLEVNELRSYGLKLGPAKRIMKCINKLKEQQLSRNNVSEA